jgi:hypothetical protein
MYYGKSRNLKTKSNWLASFCSAFLIGCIILSVSSHLDGTLHGDGCAAEGVCAGRHVPYW